MHLDIGLCSATVIKASLIDLIEVAARHGYPTISVRPYTYLQAIEQGYTSAQLRQLLRDAGVRVSGIEVLLYSLPGVPPPETLDPALRAVMAPDWIDPPPFEKSLDCGEALEAPYLSTTHFRGTPVPAEHLADAIGQLCRRAARRGLSMSIEPMPDTGLHDIGVVQQVIELSGEPNCKISLDPCQFDRAGGTIDDIRRLPPNALAGMQLCDRIRVPAGTQHVPMAGWLTPGEGELPLYEIIHAAVANSPGISAELEVLTWYGQDISADEIASRLAASVGVWRKSLRE